MKRLFQTCSLIGLFLALMISAQAQISKTYRIKIPFDFNIGQEAYKAGTYQVNLMDSRLIIRNKKTNTVKVLPTSFEEKGKSFEEPQFYFNRVEGKTELVEIAGKYFNVKVDALPTARVRVSEHATPPAVH